MDLQVLFFLLFTLFTAGHSLSCYECMGLTGSCADQELKTCPSGFSKCMSLSTVAQAGDITAEVKDKDCAADCVSGSMNFGIVKNSLACCDTDQCNLQDAPDASTVPNGKTCYSCDGQSCLKILSCAGSEDRCIKATGRVGSQSIVLKGCASKSICDATTSVSDVQGISCCEGNLCNGAKSVTQSNSAKSVTQSNSAKSVTQSFLFLCCSLLSFILLH